MNKLMPFLLVIVLFPGVAFSQKMRVCVPKVAETETPVKGLRSIGTTVDYESLCSKPGYSCKDSPNTNFDSQYSKCFYITNIKGKIPMAIEPKSQLMEPNKNGENYPTLVPVQR